MKPICERKETCIFLEKEIVYYSYPIHARSNIMVSGKQLNYYCTNPKKVDSLIGKKILSHEAKYKKCGFKATKKLGDFINVVR